MTHIWKIDNVERLTESGLITRIDYRCSTEHSGHTESHHGELELEGDITSTDFIAYGDLTELQILDWVYSKLDLDENKINKTQVETKHSESIVELINVLATIPSSSSGLPWESYEEE
tara:strand:- start:2684 stop:3034 length:351 start_codon:yes stop_codon:yes gene_type:complete